jgi:DNA-binding NarL/FixJ family response regulator
VALRLATRGDRRDTVGPVTAQAPRRVVLLAASAAGLDALERSVAGRDDVRVVGRVTRVADALAIDADLVVAQPEALAPAGSSLAASPDGRGPAADDALPPPDALTPRELDVLERLAEGRANRDIAASLGISEHTVKFHLASIFGKLGVSTRTAAVQRALKLGTIRL